VPDEPQRLERGLWIAHHRIEVKQGRSLQAELRERLPRALPVSFRPTGPLQAMRVNGYPALKQNVEIAAATVDALPRRGSYVLVGTPWGVLEVLGTTAAYGADEVRAGLKMALTSLRCHAPSALPPASAPGIADARGVLGSWKGPEGSLHFLPGGQVRLERDAVTTVATSGQANDGLPRPEPMDGSFTAEGDVIRVVWDDGSKLNYRWRAQGNDLLIMDHTGESSRLTRLFDSPAGPAGSIAPAASKN
jgi:hypothetical protein